VDGWTIFFLVVNAAGVIGCLVLAVRAGRADGGLRRRIWLAEAAAYTGLSGLVWLANPAMTLGVVSLFVPNAAMAGFALWMAMGLGGRSAGSGVGSGGDTVDVLVVFQRSIFLSPLPSPSVAAADATGGLCQPPAPGNLMDSGFRSITMAVQIDLPSGSSASTVQDASQP
jgi:hypothetical protein